MKDHIIGIDIGGTKCAVTLAKRNKTNAPEIIDKVKFPTQKDDPYGVLAAFMRVLDDMLNENALKYSDIHAIGVSCGSPLNSKEGIIMSPPNLPAWDNIAVCEYFEKKTGIKCRLQNDANACAVAEWKYGAGRGCSSMVFLTFGTGLGAGLILDGRLYCGCNDNAGEVGRVRLEKSGAVGYGKPGSCEGFCSGGGLAQLGAKAMQENGKDTPLYKACGGDAGKVTAQLIAELADNGDEVCIGIYRQCGEKLGRTIAILNDILDVERFVIGGIYMRAAHLLTDGMRQALSEEALSVPDICPAGLGENIGDYAALGVAEM